MSKVSGFLARVREVQRHWIGRVSLGLAIAGLSAGALHQFASPIAHRFPFFSLYPAVIISAWLGGALSGIVAAACTAALIHWLWTGGVSDLDVSTVVQRVATGIFFVMGVVISVVQGRLRHAQDALNRDVDARKRVEEELRQSLRREAEANRAKDDFLANLSHELRTPLNVVLGHSRMLTARPCERTCADAPRMSRSLATIERNAVAQMRIIEDLLDVQRIVSGRFRIEYGTCDLGQLGRGVVESLLPTANAKSLDLRITLQPVTMEGDGARIQQVLWNLLANAIKFTPEGGRVGLDVVRHDGEVVIRVDDSGEGIPADFLPYVFERFRQLDMSATRRHEGMGLGLAIVRHVVEAHGGTVTAESQGAGKGSTFTVRLPAAGPLSSSPASR